MNLLARWAERFLPPQTLRQGEATRARALALIVLLLDGFVLALAGVFLCCGQPATAALVLIASLVTSMALPILRRWGLRWATHWWGALFFCSLVAAAAWQGTLASIGAWMGLLLLLLCMVGGVSVGRVWLAPICGAYTALVGAQQAGLLPGRDPLGQDLFLPELISSLVFFVAVFAVASSYERITLSTLRQLVEARDRAHDASRAKSEFLAVMSHEIRTPLNGILGLGELLRQSPLDDEQRQLLAAHRSSGEALMALVNDILDFSKIEAGSMGVERIPLSVAALVDDVAALFEPAAAEKGLRLESAVAALPERVLGDPVRIRQILSNLVSNAIKFTPSGGVTIEACAIGERLELSVTDTGIGVPPSRQEELFEAFTQAESSTTRRFGGTGLGLAISRQLAVLMGGTLDVDSDGRSGSRFRLSLPLFPATARPPAPPAPARALSGRVLLVEDNPVNQLVGQKLLESLGLTVEIAPDGEEALRRLAAGSYGLVLMDCQMPRMDGYTAARLARQRGLDVPIVALTADVTAEARAAVRAAGMDDYLCKPVDRRRLQRALRRHLRAA